VVEMQKGGPAGPQVALQQSLPPLRQPPPILPQSGKTVESVPRTSRRPPHPGLDAEKTSRCPAREKCFYLTSPLIEPAPLESKAPLRWTRRGSVNSHLRFSELMRRRSFDIRD
jgi:hypothetical protein